VRCAVVLTLIAALASLPASAQTTTPGQDAYPNNYPPALPVRKGPAPPKFVFEPLGEVALPGPLPNGPLWLDEGRLRLAVAGGMAWVPPDAHATPEVAGSEAPHGGPAAPHATDDGWTLSPDGGLRFHVDHDGRMRAQRRSRFSRDGWRKAWTIRTPRAIATPPLLIGRRLFFAGFDDRIYAVRADNGHRLWAVDVGERVSRPLTRWSGTIPAVDARTHVLRAETVDLLLTVPDSGDSLEALDAYDGTIVGRLTIPSSQGWLTSSPVLVNESQIAVARQGYVPQEAALALFELRSRAAMPGPDAPSGDPPR
jgi:hypothetical protein